MPNPSMMVVLITVMINMMGVGLAWPILPLLVKDLTGANVSEIALTYGAIAIGFSVMQFAVAPFMGILSDRFGRKPIMLISLCALGADNIMLALAPSIGWMLAGRLIGGAFASTMAIANAYVADTTEEKDRAKGFGLIGAAFGVGFVIGPVLGGFLGEIDLRLPFWFAAAISFLNAGFGWFFLQESLPAHKRKARTISKSNPLSSIYWIFTTSGLSLIALVVLLQNSVQRGMESLWVLFTHHTYGWGMQEAGFSLAVVGICFIFVQGVLAGKIIPYLGEVNTIIYGGILSAAMFMMLAFNTWGLLGFIGIVPYVLGSSLASTALQTLASKQVSDSDQGYLQGAISGIGGLSAIIGPLIASGTFALFTSSFAPFDFPGAYFLLGAIVFVIAASLISKFSRVK